jgi:hypothetical protein
MGTIMTLYDVVFSCFSHRVSGVLQHLLYLQIFPTGFFKYYIHSSRHSRAQNECYNTKSCDHKRQEPRTATAPATAAVIGTRRP